MNRSREWYSHPRQQRHIAKPQNTRHHPCVRNLVQGLQPNGVHHVHTSTHRHKPSDLRGLRTRIVIYPHTLLSFNNHV